MTLEHECGERAASPIELRDCLTSVTWRRAGGTRARSLFFRVEPGECRARRIEHAETQLVVHVPDVDLHWGVQPDFGERTAGADARRQFRRDGGTLLVRRGRSRQRQWQ